MERKIKVIRFVCVVVLIAALVISLLFWMRSQNTSQRTIETNWKIKFPSDMEEVFYIQTPDSFHGDGERYTVFHLSEKPTDFLSDFSSEKSDEFVSSLEKDTSHLNIPEEYLPQWEERYLWKTLNREPVALDRLYMIYFPSQSKLIVCQYYI